jgi:hypothetical protein
VVGVYAGTSLAGLTRLAIASSGYSDSGVITLSVTAGQTYTIAVDSIYPYYAGYFSLSIIGPPDNDNFANRIALTGDSLDVDGSNVRATREQDEPNPLRAGIRRVLLQMTCQMA